LNVVEIVLEVIHWLFTVSLTAYVAWPKKNDQAATEAAFQAFNSKLRELDADIDDVFDRLKRLTSRKGMQARREDVKSGATLPGETPEQWKARMRRAKNSNGAIPASEEV